MRDHSCHRDEDAVLSRHLVQAGRDSLGTSIEERDAARAGDCDSAWACRGPVTALSQNAGQLTVNHRWALSATLPCGHYVGDENQPGWMTAHRPRPLERGSRVGLCGSHSRRRQPKPAGEEIRLVLSDLQPPVEMERSYRDAETRASGVPDPRMQASMNAQISHLMMSLVDDETRPGDPALFYRAWHRQGPISRRRWPVPEIPKSAGCSRSFWRRMISREDQGRKPTRRAWRFGAHRVRRLYCRSGTTTGYAASAAKGRANRGDDGGPLAHCESYTVPAPHDFQHLRQTRTGCWLNRHATG